MSVLDNIEVSPTAIEILAKDQNTSPHHHGHVKNYNLKSGNCSPRIHVEMASSYGTSLRRIKPGKWNHIEQQNLGKNLSLHCWQERTTT